MVLRVNCRFITKCPHKCSTAVIHFHSVCGLQLQIGSKHWFCDILCLHPSLVVVVIVVVVVVVVVVVSEP